MRSSVKSPTCLFCRISTTPFVRGQSTLRQFITSTPYQQSFSTSPAANSRRKPSFINIKASAFQSPTSSNTLSTSKPLPQHLLPSTRRPSNLNPQKEAELANISTKLSEAAALFRPYTPREIQLLRLKYTPSQVAAILAGEKTINLQDLAAQGSMRTDQMTIDYKDDLSAIMPHIDHTVRGLDKDVDPDIQFLSDEETKVKVVEWYENIYGKAQEQDDLKENTETSKLEEELADQRAGLEAGLYPGDGLSPSERMERMVHFARERDGIDDDAEFERFAGQESTFMFSPKGKLGMQKTSLQPDLPVTRDPRVQLVDESLDQYADAFNRETGLGRDAQRSINSALLVTHRVVNQTRLGKIQSHYCLSVAGNGSGMLGIGEATSTEMTNAVNKSAFDAMKNMKPVPMYEKRTIFGESGAKVGASIVKLSARPSGML